VHRLWLFERQQQQFELLRLPLHRLLLVHWHCSALQQLWQPPHLLLPMQLPHWQPSLRQQLRPAHRQQLFAQWPLPRRWLF
jgi:hypothetical protein